MKCNFGKCSVIYLDQISPSEAHEMGAVSPESIAGNGSPACEVGAPLQKDMVMLSQHSFAQLLPPSQRPFFPPTPAGFSWGRSCRGLPAIAQYREKVMVSNTLLHGEAADRSRLKLWVQAQAGRSGVFLNRPEHYVLTAGLWCLQVYRGKVGPSHVKSTFFPAFLGSRTICCLLICVPLISK